MADSGVQLSFGGGSPMPPAEGTQEWSVYRVLYDAREGSGGYTTYVCGNVFLSMHIPRYAARIYDLRKRGFQIARMPCKIHSHKSSIASYALIGKEVV